MASQKYPLSFPQQAVFLDALLHGRTTKFNMSGGLLIRGPVDSDLFRQAIEFASRQHDVRRMRLHVEGNEAQQEFVEDAECRFELRDFSQKAEPLRSAIESMVADAARPMQVDQFPLCEDVLFRLAADLYLWFPRFHHISNDGHGHWLITETVAAAYNSLKSHGTLPELQPFSYADFIADDRKYAGSKRFREDEAFWREKFAAMPEPLPFTARKGQLKGDTQKTDRCTLTLSRLVYNAVLHLCDEAEVTPFQFLLAAFSAYLYRVTGRDDIVIGTPILNRSNRAFRATAGMFMNMMPLRIVIEKEATIFGLARQIAAELRSCYRHQRFPLTEILRHCRTLDGYTHGVFDVTMVYRKLDYDLRFAGASTRAINLDGQVRDETLSLAVDDYNTGEEVSLYFNYNPQLISPEEAGQMAKAFQTLLIDLAVGGDLPVSTLRLLSDDRAPASSKQPNSIERTVLDLFAQRVERAPDSPAIADGTVRMSYGELAAASSRVAGFLDRECHLKPEQPVAVLSDRNANWIAALLGIMQAGGAYLPLDPEAPRERLEFILKDSGCRLLLADEAHSSSRFPDVGTVSINQALAAPPLESPAKAGVRSLAYIIYTSGTTGTPKGVLVEHAGLANTAAEQARGWELTPQDAFLQFAAPMFDASIAEVFAALAAGARIVIARKEVILNPADFLELLSREKVTVAVLPPAYLSTLGRAELPSLRLLGTAGEAANPADLAHYNRTLTCINAYGPTEASICATFLKLSPGSGFAGERVPIGKPLPHTDVYILNEDLQRMPIGAVGEICVGGVNVARGYLNRPDLTNERFVPNPFQDGERLYRTGDLGRQLPDGNIEYLGRRDAQIKIRGYRVEPGEIETLLKTHPSVETAVVVGRAQGDLVAYVVARGAFSPDELRSFLAAKLPPYMIPARWVKMSALPVNSSGKVDRDALPAPPEPVTRADSFQAPATPAERDIADIWQKALGCGPISRTDNIFGLGGDSLLCAGILLQIHRRFGVRVPIAKFFAEPTVERLARLLEAALPAKKAPLSPAGSGTPEDEFPCSPAQEGMWLARRDHPGATTYSVVKSFRLKEHPSADQVYDALRRLLVRHEALRTVFREHDGRLMQSIVPSTEPAFTIHQSPRVVEILRRETGLPFDLEHGPLARFRFSPDVDGSPVLLGSFDHLVVDGASLAILHRELNAILEGREAELPPASGYISLSLKLRASLEGSRGEVLQKFWQSRLERTPLEPLPSDSGDTPGGRRLVFEFDAATSDALESLSQTGRITPTMVWLTVVTALLARYKAAGLAVAVGMPFAGRPSDEFENAIGCFANVLPVRVENPSTLTFAELAAAVKDETLSVMQHQEYPFSWLARDAAALRGGDQTLLDAVALLEELSPELNAGLSDNGADKFPLSLVLAHQGRCAKGLIIEYQPRHYSQERMERLAGHLQNLIKVIAERPDQPIAQLSFLSAEESRKLTKEFNSTARAYPRDKSLAELFREVAVKHADGTAIVHGSQQLSYWELDRYSDGLARGLVQAGVTPGTTVALAIDRGGDAVAATLAVVKAGAVYLPLDASLPPALASRLLQTAGANLIVADTRGRNDYAQLGARILGVESLAVEGEDSPVVQRSGGDAAYVMFTSGSSGEPKGVVVPHRGIARLVMNADVLSFSPEDAMTQVAPLGFDASTLEIWAPLLSGARMVVVDSEVALHPAAFDRTLQAAGVTMMVLTTSLFNRIADEAPQCFRFLHRLFVGGEALSVPHVRKAMQACPHLELYNGYGPTENTTFTTLHRVTAEDLVSTAVPIGRPIANTQVFVLDEALQLVPIGVWGELCAAGDGLALGYAGREQQTAQAFVTLGGKQRVYRTGDLARWRADGVLEFGGRRDGQIKLRGHRIETEAIEAVLCAQPGIRDAAVVVERETLVAVVASDAADETAWRAALQQVVPSFMVPERFVVVPAIPVTANGKKDRRAALALAVRDADSHPVSKGRTPAPGAEALIARLFAEVFGDTASTIDADSDFFQMGGHSLLAMRLAGLIEKETGTRPLIRDLLSARTVAGIAALLQDTAPVEMIPRASGPTWPLSSGQSRLWVLQRLHDSSGLYNVPVALDLAGPLDIEALNRALTALEERQHALRLRLTPSADEPSGVCQTLAAPGALRLQVVDLTAEADPLRAADERVSEELARPFDLAHDVPMRAILMKLAPECWRLMMVLHHSVCDGWSMPILLRDLEALYAGRPLAPLARNYEDFAAWQHQYLQSPESRPLLQHWRERLTPLPEPLALPLDHHRPAVRRGRGAVVQLSLDTDTSRRLSDLAGSANATPFTVLLAALQVLLYRHSGQTDLSLGTLSAGRDRAELADVVGFFVNTLVLRQNIDSTATFRTLLNQTRSTLLDAVSNQDCPFETVVDAVNAPRDTSRNPLFDVLAVWQDNNPDLSHFLGTAATPVDFPFPFSKFDLEFYFQAFAEGVHAYVILDTDLFEAPTVEALLRRFEVVTAAALQNPDAPLSDLPWMSEGEAAQVVHGFNSTAVELPDRQTIPQPFLAQVARNGNATAAITRNQTLTYTAFARRAAHVAEQLARCGVKPGSVVAVCAHRSLEMLAAIHGILLAGAAYAPIDPDYPEARRANILEDLGEPPIVAAADCAALFPPDRVLVPASGESELVNRADDPDALAYVIFTSGSTGRPKGVGIEHHSVLNRILWMQSTFPIGPGDVILQKTTVCFDVSVWELFWWSWTGAAVALAPQGAEKDPAALADAVERFGVTVMHFVPSMLAAFLASIEDGRVSPARLRRLRYVFASGEALDAHLVERFNRLLHEPYGVELHNLYGPTEATVDVTWQPCSPWNGGEVVPIGKPIANTRILILNENGQPVPIGVPGEIYIGGPQVARGYINRPELTAERFVPDPTGSGDRLYRTGDGGRWRPDGTVEYLGRLDGQVKIRGFRIECGEVEHVLESHPSVEHAVVRPVTTGGLTELHAYVVGARAEAAALRAHLRSRLPDYMVPARFFRLQALPLTSNGKLDRKRLSGEPLEAAAAVDSATPIEAELMALWHGVLGHSQFGPHDGFFDVGGNSLLLLRLHACLEERWPGLFTVAGLFACSNIAAQARRIEQACPSKPAEDQKSGQSDTHPGAVAIVGMAVRLAGFEDLDSFWRDLVNAADRVRPLPEKRESEARALLAAMGSEGPEHFHEAAYLDDIYGFDPGRFRMAPADATMVDPEQRIFYETAQSALEDAGYGGSALNGHKVGAFVGAGSSASYPLALKALLPDKQEQIFALNAPSNAATRLAFLHDWSGPAMLVDTACSAALTALHQACLALQNGECEAALVGGAKVLPVPPADNIGFAIDSSTGRTRAFAAGSDGTGMGEGAAVFLLKPLARAQADGDTIHAIILGSAVNQDGASSGMAAPNPLAQAAVIRAAAESAEVELASLSYIEAHGTGTELGDPIEVEGLTRAFAGTGGDVALGSVKGNYGHLDSAAGALGLAKAVLCLQHGQVPPQPFFDAPNPLIDFAHAPVKVAQKLAPLVHRDCPLRAGVSSFGLSGINAHVILEEAPSARLPVANPADGLYVVALSAGSAEALRRYRHALHDSIADQDISIADIAHTLATGRAHLRYRFAVAVRDRRELLKLLAGDTEAVEVSVQRGTRPTVPAFAATENAAQIAVAGYLTGADLCWPSEAGPARRLHLPPAPFTRQSCWPAITKEVPAQKASHIHPASADVGGAATRCLGAAVSTPEGKAFAVPVHASDFWPAAEHLLDGRPTLVGMTFPCLVSAAAQGLGMPEVEIRDLRWMRKLRPDELAEGEVSVQLKAASDGSWQAGLGGRLKAGEWMEFASAQVASLVDPPMGVDLAALRKRCPVAVPLAPFSNSSGPVTVSNRWDCRAEVWASPDQRLLLARLRLPENCRADLMAYRLHPALLDVATGLALDGVSRVPAACAAIRVFDSLPAEVLAYVIRRQADEDALEADITLYDPDGRIRVALVGMRFLALHGKPAVPLSTPVWQAAPLAQSARRESLWLAGSGALAEELSARLSQTGMLAGRARDAAEILASGATDVILAVDAGEQLWPVADLLRQLMQGLQRKLRVLVVSRRAFSRNADDAPPAIDAALFAGLVLSASQEEPMLALRYLDLDEASSADTVAAEFAAFDAVEAQPVTMVRDGLRYQRSLVNDSSPDSSATTVHWPTSGCCVVTGGTGGFALALAEEFSGHGQLSLALLSRTGEVTGDEQEARGRREKLAALQRSGCRVRVYACDVADSASLDATLTRIRAELGPVTAVVHAAGVADSGFLVNRSQEAFETVLKAKVEGARNLDVLTRTDPVQAFVLFSSITGLVGAPGQTAYSAANAWLDSFAEWRLRQGRPALAIDWCTLSGIGMAARHGADKLGGVVVSPAQLPALWKQILSASAVQVAVVDSGKAKLATPAPVAKTTAVPSSKPAPVIEKPSHPASVLEAALATIWAEVLGYDSVTPDDDYFALGGDSLSGMQIVSQIRSDLGYTIKVPDLLEAGTVKALAEKLRGTAAPADTGIEAAPAQAAYPVGWEQRDVLRAESSSEMGTAFNLPHVLELPASISTERLSTVLTQLVSRYDILRTRFREESEDWVMEVLPPSPPALPEVDLTNGPDPVAACNALLEPFDWRSAPPMRFALLRLPQGRRALLFDLHHSLADGFTVELLVADLTALCAGKDLPAPARQFKDYAWWSRNGEGAKLRDDARQYWLNVYQGTLPRLDLPADRPRPPIHTWRCDVVSSQIHGPVLQRLRAFAAEHHVTPFVVVLSAWAALFEKLAASDDLVIAVPVDNRDRAGLEKMPGMMVGLLPLRLGVHNGDRIGALLEHIQSVHAEAMRHRAFGLGSLLEELAPPASPDRTWLSEVTLSYMNFAEGTPDDSGFRLTGLQRKSIKGDLSIFVRDLPGSLNLSIEFYTGLFDRERIERMGSGFTALLSALVNAPSESIVADLPAMDDTEAAQVREFENGPQAEQPSGKGLAALFTASAQAWPDRVALEDAAGSWAYRQLAVHANGIAQKLLDTGVRPGDLVALAMKRGTDAIAALLGIVMAGAGYVPLDPDYPAERKRQIAADAGVRLAIADAEGHTALKSAPGITVLDASDLMGCTSEAPPALNWRGDPDGSPAYLMYTSGSTGQPKGVLIPQRAVVRLVFGDAFAAISSDDCVLQAGPLAFDASTWEIWGTLLRGGRLALASRDEVLDPSALALALVRYRVTALFLTTSLFNRQVNYDPGCFQHVRLLFTGGEAMSAAHAGRLLRACPSVRLINAYGPTENTSFTTFHIVRSEDVEQPSIPIGRPLAANRVAILDAAGCRVPIGVWGEICAGGPGLADGYWEQPELTRERFIADPKLPSERLYRTGDIGRWRADGLVEFRGRLDTQIKLRGIRIELDEIEQAINRHPAVARAAVRFANEELTACLVLRPDAGPLTDTAMRTWLGHALPAAMVPTHWVSAQDIPVNANGKTDRKRLADVIENASPLCDEPAEPPSTEAERCVAEAFSEVLDRPINDRRASFLDLGGHSLQAIRVVNRIAQRTGVRLRMGDFFAASSLEALAQQIERSTGACESHIPQAPEAARYPASHAQQRLYLMHRMQPDSGAYNIALVFRCDGSLDAAAFLAALGGLVERHETLRTVFEEIDGAILQRVVPDVVPPVEVDDLRSRPDARAEALRLAHAEVTIPFDLSRAPLVRARILQVSSDETIVLLVVDHIAADGWSMRILIQELGVLYKAALAGTESGLAPLAVTYKDYAVWQSTQDWTAAAAFWRKKLAGAPERIALPCTHPLPEVQSYRGATCRRPLSAEVLGGLRELAHEQGVTLAAVGMAIFAALLYRLTRQPDMVLGMGVAGRDRAELEGQIGFFVNVLPIRLELDEQSELEDVIRQTQAVMLEALDRRDYPFDLLVRDVAPRRQTNRQPLINVVFEYQRFSMSAPGSDLPFAKQDHADEDLNALIESPTAKHDMILFFRDEDEAGELILEHDTDILDPETASRWLDFYSRFAAEAAHTAGRTTTQQDSRKEE